MSRKSDSNEPGDITAMLDLARGGEAEAVESLLLVVYRELRRTAQAMIGRESPGHTLFATDLVHEAFLRLFEGKEVSWESRQHFFGSAASAMRRVLIDHARKRRAGKRIPKEDIVPIEAASDVLDLPEIDLLSLDHALNQLAKKSTRQARIVELRFFAGLSETEVAEVLGVSRMTVTRDWTVARLRLRVEMAE